MHLTPRRRNARRLVLALSTIAATLLLAGCSPFLVANESTEQGASGFEQPHLQFDFCPSANPDQGGDVVVQPDARIAVAATSTCAAPQLPGADFKPIDGPSTPTVVGLLLPAGIDVDGHVSVVGATPAPTFTDDAQATAFYNDTYAHPGGAHWVAYRADLPASASGVNGRIRFDVPVSSVDVQVALPSSFAYSAIVGFKPDPILRAPVLVEVDRQAQRLGARAELARLNAIVDAGPADPDYGSCNVGFAEAPISACDLTSDMRQDNETGDVIRTPATLTAHIRSFSVAAGATAPAAVTDAGSTDAAFSVALTGPDLAGDAPGIALAATTDVPGGSAAASSATARPTAATPVAETVHVTVPAGTPAGDYHVTLRGTAGTLVRSATTSLHVSVTPVAAGGPVAVAGAAAAPQPFLLISTAFSKGCTLVVRPHGCSTRHGRTVTITGRLRVLPLGTATTLELGTVRRVGRSGCAAATGVTYAKVRTCSTTVRSWHKVQLGAQDADGYFTWSQALPKLPTGTYVVAARVTAGTFDQTVIGAPLQLVVG